MTPKGRRMFAIDEDDHFVARCPEFQVYDGMMAWPAIVEIMDLGYSISGLGLDVVEWKERRP